MTRVHDFVVDLAKGGKSFGEIKKLVDDVYGDKALKKTQIYEILKQLRWAKTLKIEGDSTSRKPR